MLPIISLNFHDYVGLPGAGIPGVALPGYPVSSQHYPAPGGSTAAPLATSHASLQPFPSGTSSIWCPRFKVKMPQIIYV